jgi:hypothetical protein
MPLASQHAARSEMAADGVSPRLRSFDAWTMISPRSAFQHIVPLAAGDWRLSMRRPIALAILLGCLASLCATGSLTLRIVGPASVYWAYAPLVEALALVLIIWTRTDRARVPAAIDAFFAGHGPWVLLLAAIAASWAFLPPARAWTLLTTVGVAALPVVLGWSAYIDFCFFRAVLDGTRATAVRDVVAHRMLTWPMVFWIFAVPSATLLGIVPELIEALKEVLTR